MSKYNTALTILAVLYENSSSENKLNQKAIGERIKAKYNYKPDRQTIRRGIDDIIRVGFPIKYRSFSRGSEHIITDLYYEK